MQRILRISLALTLLSVAACSSGGNPVINKPKDASVQTDSGEPADSGMQGTVDTGVGPTDSGVPPVDSGMPPVDSGVPATCDPVSGGGCGMAGQQCIVVPSAGMAAPQCRLEVSPAIAFEQACNVQAANCAHGYACITFANEMPTCRKVCHRNRDSDCAGLVGTSTAYSCLLPFSNDYGLCAPTPHACVPYNDTCPAMQYCQSISQTTTGCIPEGTANVGDACNATACKKGGECLQFQGDATPKCYQPCDTANPVNTCGMSGACRGIQGYSFGYCAANVACTPLMDTCPATEACAQVAANTYGCAPEGAQPGQSCPMGTCTKGYICAGASAASATCHQACDASHACMGGATCQMLQGSALGVCP